jgi:hypothetical protein
MPDSPRRLGSLLLVAAAVLQLEAATLSKQNADVFTRKIAQIQQHSIAADRLGSRRTPLTQDELNSWFTYTARPYLPTGVMDPQVTIVGEGKLTGQAVVDLDAVAKTRASGGRLDPWSFVGGRVPVSVTGLLHTREGVGRFEVQTAEISGVPIPTTLLQELLGYYSRSPERPQGLRLGDAFPLPARIQQIEVGQGQAVVVQ